jgi:hypothetical protein
LRQTYRLLAKRVEGGSIIFTVDDNINITYIKDITDISTLSVGFVQVLIVHLAYMLAGKLTQSDGAVDELMSGTSTG